MHKQLSLFLFVRLKEDSPVYNFLSCGFVSVFSCFQVKKAVLDNNGYGFKIEFPDKDRFMWSTALPGSPYTLLQVHIHFGSKEGYGSEHTLNGVHYPAEVSITVSFLIRNSAEGSKLKFRNGKRYNNEEHLWIMTEVPICLEYWHRSFQQELLLNIL